jgi:acetyl esterase
MYRAKSPATHPIYPIIVKDLAYCVVGGRSLRAMVYIPKGDGPFPAIVCVHGGAWVSGDRTATQGFADLIASCGVVVVAIDFRLAPSDPYPSSLVDINYAIRWVKQHAAEFSADANMVGGLGVSSGGHLVLLSALRPFDVRYASIPLQGITEGIDARLAFVVTCSGVLDPLARYRMAQQIGDRDMLQCHDAYFGSEDVMSEASPPLMLERGESLDLPPALFFQGECDPRVPSGTAERTARLYMAAGGEAMAVVYPGMGHAVGEWGRAEVFDMLARIMALISQQSATMHDIG